MKNSLFAFLFCIALLPASLLQAQTLPDAKCKEFKNSRFKPCICANEVPKQIRYRPSVRACGGKAGAILSGSYASSFSVVLRDNQNRDRWPASGYNDCSAEETADGLNKCSAFKCQKVIRTPGQQICCFGETGTSSILRGATRLTIKFKDIPNAGNDPLARVCLNKFSPRTNLN
jgi:hypothetical protein